MRCGKSGFGVVFPEIDGEPGFDDIGAVLDAIERLPVQVVIPGHGAPFTDVAAALARSRLAAGELQHAPSAMRAHAAKVMIKYHVMEERRIAHDARCCSGLRRRRSCRPHGSALATRHSDSPALWCARLVNRSGGRRRAGTRRRVRARPLTAGTAPDAQEMPRTLTAACSISCTSCVITARNAASTM